MTVRSILMLALSSGAAAAASAETTISIHLLGFQFDGIQGSIVGADAATTTVSLNCPSDRPNDDECQYLDKYTLTYEPSTVEYTVSTTMKDHVTMTNIGDCQLQIADDVMTCTGRGELIMSGETSKMTETFATSSFIDHPLYGTVTAGVEKLGENRDDAIPGASATDTAYASVPTSLPTHISTTYNAALSASFIQDPGRDISDCIQYWCAHGILLVGSVVVIGAVALIVWRARSQLRVKPLAVEALHFEKPEKHEGGIA